MARFAVTTYAVGRLGKINDYQPRAHSDYPVGSLPRN